MLFSLPIFNIDSFLFSCILETTTETFVFVLHVFIFQRTTITTKTIRPTTTKKQQQQKQ
jgi:hypothetical protein